MDNCSSIEPWTFRHAFPESSFWISDAFARENEAVTKALQISLSDDSSGSTAPVPSSETLSAATSSFLLHQFVKTEPAASPAVSASDPGSKRARIPVPCSPSGKITKRKSRASKRSPTTYITADPANFRQMVQQVTGVRFSEPGLSVEPVLKPEPQRPGAGRAALQQSCLPTLDTSAFLLDRAVMQGTGFGGLGSGGPDAVESPAFDFDSFQSFPTLESWGVM